MAAFSSPSSFQHQHPFQLSNKNMCALFEESNINNINPFSQFHHPPPDHQTLEINNNISLGQHSTKLVSPPANYPQSGTNYTINEEYSGVFSDHVTNKNNSMDNSSSIVTDKYYSCVATPMDSKRKCTDGSSPNCAQSKDTRGTVKGKKQKKMKDGSEENNNNNKQSQVDDKKGTGGDKEGYIHVRARRGQATDSHSLAERVRRERISERMKLLQALVPGCDKVTGKALMLDEIINYVQSLQNQVEFLSMKLASVNPMLHDFGMDLESFMVRPEQNLSSLPSALGGMEHCNPTNPICNPYPILDIINSNNSFLFQQAHPLQGHRQVLWEVEDQRQKTINQTGINNTLFSFH